VRHLDLFSGIGGFALACKWAGIETVAFVEIDKFCQKVLRKHWPGVPIVEDINNVIEIKEIIADAAGRRCGQCLPLEEEEGDIDQPDSLLLRQTRETSTNSEGEGGERWQRRERDSSRDETRLSRCADSLLLTAGFPCQPFSNAGHKRGARDDRYLWPQTLAVIQALKPAWVLLENVTGILGMVFPDSKAHMASQAPLLANQDEEAGGYTAADYDTIAGGINRDLEKAGYKTGWLIVPACAVGAPHRRDRVWIIAYAINGQHRGGRGQAGERGGITADAFGDAKRSAHRGKCGKYSEGRAEPSVSQRDEMGCDFADGNTPSGFTPDADGNGLQGSDYIHKYESGVGRNRGEPQWREDWYEVAARFCRMDARISHRVDRLKGLGNAIVPQVAYEIIRNIQEAEGAR